MSFGAIFTGNSGQVIIDQDHPVYQYVTFGTYASGTGGGNVSVTFSSPIQSPEPPLIFIRPDGAHVMRNVVLQGSANNWTGFTCTLFADSSFSGIAWTGTWKAAAIYLPLGGTWGLKIMDSSSRVVFDSNRNSVVFLSGAQSWTKVGRNPSWQGTWTTDTWGMPYTAGAWALVNPWLGLYSGTTPSGDMGIGFLNGNYNTATQINSFLMRLGVGQPNVTNFNWPLILAA